uniref:C2H2-type domain-containing protein n=1 Tax=Ditylenchus dipsaci TaxID=166011 RepID=A0A915D828_9BILA
MNDDSLFSNAFEEEDDNVFRSSPKKAKMMVLSAQERYNQKVIAVDKMRQRMCYECGEFIATSDYQKHTLEHEAVYLSYQLYYFERREEQNMQALKNRFASNSQEPSQSATQAPVKDSEENSEDDTSSVGSSEDHSAATCSKPKLVVCPTIHRPQPRKVPPLVVNLTPIGVYRSKKVKLSTWQCDTNTPSTSREGSIELSKPAIRKRSLKARQSLPSAFDYTPRIGSQKRKWGSRKASVQEIDIRTRDAYYLLCYGFTPPIIEIASITNDVQYLTNEVNNASGSVFARNERKLCAEMVGSLLDPQW